VMAGGRILADGPPDALVAEHADPALYRLEVAGAPAPGDSPGAIPGVRGLGAAAGAPGRSAWSITGDRGAPDLREALGRWAADRALVVTELTRERTSLERVFHGLIAGVESGDTERRA